MNKKIFCIATILIMVIAFSVCHAEKLIKITDKERNEVSEQMLAEIVKVNGPVKNIPREEKVAQIFYSLVEKVDDENKEKYRLVLIDKNIINAYAMPNGTVAVYKGLLDAMPENDVGMIAFVLAHEIMHIAKRHGDKAIQNQLLTGLGLAIVLGKSDKWMKLAGVVAFGLLTSGFSREQETEADEEGVKLMQKANYDPKGGIAVMRLFKNMEKKNKTLLIFPKHPKSEDREKNITNLLKEEHIAVDIPKSNSVAVINNSPIPQNGSAFSQSTIAVVQKPLAISKTNYSDLTNEDIKRGYYLSKWEKAITANIVKKTNFNLQSDDWLKTKARSMTFDRFQSNENNKYIILTFMIDSYWSCRMFIDHLNQTMPDLKEKTTNYHLVGVAVKRNLQLKKHIVIVIGK